MLGAKKPKGKCSRLSPKSKASEGFLGTESGDLFLSFWRLGLSKERLSMHFLLRAILGAGVVGGGTLLRANEH